MPKIRLTKEFRFEMAHALRHYDGPCKNIHGHSYRLFVTVIGEPLDNIQNPKHGMLIDFSQLKKLVNEEIIDKYDHALVVAKNDERITEMQKFFENIIASPHQPTCENLAANFAELINKRLPNKISVHSIKLYETATSYAEWYASDNIK